MHALEEHGYLHSNPALRSRVETNLEEEKNWCNCDMPWWKMIGIMNILFFTGHIILTNLSRESTFLVFYYIYIYICVLYYVITTDFLPSKYTRGGGSRHMEKLRERDLAGTRKWKSLIRSTDVSDNLLFRPKNLCPCLSSRSALHKLTKKSIAQP